MSLRHGDDIQTEERLDTAEQVRRLLRGMNISRGIVAIKPDAPFP
jgi:hypothetical protein